MPLRATDADVNYLMDSSGVVYTASIATANLLVEEELVGSGLTEARLTEIEKYLAAHFATLAKERGGVVRTTSGESAESYRQVHSKYQGLNSTTFGQQAITLDTTGKLVSIGSGGMKAEFRIV